MIFEQRAAARQFGGDAASIARLREKLPPDTALLEYLVLSGRTIVWIVSSELAECIVLRAGRADVTRWSEELAKMSNERDSNRTLVASYAGLLDQPLRRLRETSAAQRLILIPDTRMAGLPFAALRDPATRRYLIEDYALSVAGSATQYLDSLMLDAHLREARPVAINALLFGDPSENLQGETREVRTIASLYESSIVRTGKDATAEAFLRQSGRSSIVHLAIPIVNNAQSPSKSLLRFAPGATDSGIVTSEDLLSRVRFENTRLVVLSGCCLDTSRSAAGLGALEMTFLAAGVPGVIGSTAPVDDYSTMRLMIAFHEQYKRGEDAADALRYAQLRMMRDTDRSSPVFWGTFRLTGVASGW
jgi:CHAT domain-containing protein